MLKTFFSKKNKKQNENIKQNKKSEETCKILPKHLTLGNKGEEKAWTYLQKKDFLLLEKNWRSHPHEIDLICMHLDTIVFIEVKSRKSHNPHDSIAAFTPTKQKHIVHAAKKYLTQKKLWHKPCRFDFVCIYHEHQNVEHFENVIEQEHNSPFTSPSKRRDFRARRTSRNPLHSSDTTWQPW